METVIDLGTLKAARPLDRRLGSVVAAIAPLVTVALVYLSHDARMHMVLARGEWCGTPIQRAQSQLYGSGFLLVTSAALLFLAWRVQVGVVVCRVSLVVAVAMWVVYVVSAARLAV